MILRVKTSNSQETERLGECLTRFCKAEARFALKGELGAGKTTFTKGVARALEIEEPVASPSFTIINEYSGRHPMLHMDFYRVKERDEFQELGVEEYLETSGVVIIEWAEKVDFLLDYYWWIIEIYLEKGDKRLIEIMPPQDISCGELEDFLKGGGFNFEEVPQCCGGGLGFI